MVEIRLFGKLRRYAPKTQDSQGIAIQVPLESDETLEKLLARLDIPVDEIYSIFLNSKLLAARTGMASWIGYRQVRKNPFDWNLKIKLASADRIGLFGRDMAALVV